MVARTSNPQTSTRDAAGAPTLRLEAGVDVPAEIVVGHVGQIEIRRDAGRLVLIDLVDGNRRAVGGDAVLLEVGRRDIEVVGRREMSLGAAEIRQLRSDARHQLVRDRGRDFPVVAPVIEASVGFGIVAGGHVDLTEGVVAQRAELRSLRDAVAVGVGVPRARRVVDRRIERVEQSREADRRGLHVAAQRPLERGLAVAEEVVGRAHPWRPGRPAGHARQRAAVDCLVVCRGCEASGGAVDGVLGFHGASHRMPPLSVNLPCDH